MTDRRGRAGVSQGLLRAVPPTAAVLLALAVWWAPASALVGVSVIDLEDPVPPGGILTYELALSPLSATVPFCFNPPPECVVGNATCSDFAPRCLGDSFLGFVCVDAANEGFDCGVGDPPIPDLTLCLPNTQRVCNGGLNDNGPCFTSADCPGETLVCRRAFNEEAYCGQGNPPVPVNEYCLANPTGICSGGPNFGQPCTAQHGQATAECPAFTEPTPVTVTLANPVSTTFLDATNGGTSDGTFVTWSLPPVAQCGTLTNPCPLLQARFTVDPNTPVGMILQTRATATDGDGFQESNIQFTSVGTFARTRLVIVNARGAGRDSFVYRTRLTLLPTQSFNPGAEGFRIQVTNATDGTLVDLFTNPGELGVGADGLVWAFNNRGGVGLQRLVVGQQTPLSYRLRVAGRRMEHPPITDLAVTVTITIGDDVFTQNLVLSQNRSGRRYFKTAR